MSWGKTKLATIAAALLLPTAAAAETKTDKAELVAAIVMHGRQCETPHSEFIIEFKKLLGTELRNELRSEGGWQGPTMTAAWATLSDRVKEAGGWGAWCRKTTGLLQRLTDLTKQ
jgi:hypothetical protein